MEWKNYGDVNFVMHGGCLVRPAFSQQERDKYPTLESLYDVFFLGNVCDGTNLNVMAGMVQVDVDDFPKNDELRLVLDNPSNEEFAVAVVEHYGIDGYYQPTYLRGQPIITRGEARDWLRTLDVDEELLHIDEW